MLRIVAVAIVITAAFIWDDHQQRRVELPLRQREWHFLRLIGTAITGASALWFELARAGYAGPPKLVQGIRLEVTPFGILSGPTWHEGLPAAAPVFAWIGTVGISVLALCTLGVHWAALLRLVELLIGKPPQDSLRRDA